MYQKMHENMIKNSDVLASSNEQGLNWVKTRDYAYFMESTSIEYITERDCEVARVGDLLDSKGYGIAMRKSEYLARYIYYIATDAW
jgi:ionotropic kainate glutamate receptor 2